MAGGFKDIFSYILRRLYSRAVVTDIPKIVWIQAKEYIKIEYIDVKEYIKISNIRVE